MLRGALIGVGNIALRGHLPAYRSDLWLRARARIVAAVDVVETRTPEAEEALAGIPVYRDLESLLQREQLDFVDICSPPDTHAAGIETCAAAGLHIVCEKPLVHRASAVEAVGRAVRGAGIVFVPCHQYKYSPLWQEIERFVRSGALGRVGLAQFSVFRLRADVGTAAWNPAWRTRKQHGGGGVLADTGAHYFYLSRWLFGMPERVTAVLRTLEHTDYDVEDTALVILESAATLAQIDVTWAANERANAVHVVGSEGSLHYDGRRLVHVRGAETGEIPMPDVTDKAQYVGWYAALLREFVRRVEADEVGADLLEEAEAVMRLLDASYEAAARRATIQVT